MNTKDIQFIKEKFPAGTEVELIHMDDKYAPPAGTRGIVESVDDIGTIHTRWANGSGLGLIYGHDSFRVIKEV